MFCRSVSNEKHVSFIQRETANTSLQEQEKSAQETKDAKDKLVRNIACAMLAR